MSSSSSTKRKHVYSELLRPELRVPSETQEIVRVMGGRGNYLHDAETANGESFIISMPTKFRRSVWVKRGDYVLVERIAEGDKVEQ
jgi:probable RNA-binding protein EIF1AD